ncbi:hypothetical protein ACJMK2_026713 [Sinanodonta woodiana]|uniref:Uncharacterized protein n=1 Tax=Sinanodonta woodiana TaxID=1069815 RepID=A0ABD3XP43_SINWO
MPANNEEEAESSDSESDEINSEQHGNDEVLVNKLFSSWLMLEWCAEKHTNFEQFFYFTHPTVSSQCKQIVPLAQESDVLSIKYGEISYKMKYF